MAGELTAFGAVSVPTPAGGGTLRRYVIDCPHATTDLTLIRRPSADLEVLTQLLDSHHALASKDEEDPCTCVPTFRQLEPLSASAKRGDA